MKQKPQCDKRRQKKREREPNYFLRHIVYIFWVLRLDYTDQIPTICDIIAQLLANQVKVYLLCFTGRTQLSQPQSTNVCERECTPSYTHHRVIHSSQ